MHTRATSLDAGATVTPNPVREVLKWIALRVPAVRRLADERRRLAARVATLERELARHDTPAARSLCQVVDPLRYESPEWLALHHELERYALDKHCFRNRSGAVYRKGWEWTQCVYGLHRLGMIQPHAVALGVGAGRECVIYYLADRIAEVVASDLYGGTSWTAGGGKEADVSLLEASKQACPASVDLRKVRFEHQDGTRLTYPDASFDFCWSLSSIEHFGGHEAAAQAMREMARVTRPGGVVAVATEMLLLEEYTHPEFFTRAEVDRFLVHATPRLELVAPIDYDALPVEYLIDGIVFPHGVERLRRHVVLNDGNVQWTSLMLFFRVRA